MKRTSATLVAAAVAAVASGGLLVGGAVGASASSAPPWEPDHTAVGSLTFYNAAGSPITSGSISSSPIAAYVEGSAQVRAGDTKATLYGFKPVPGQKPGQWTGQILSASTTYPNSAAPGALKTASLPVVTGAAGDASVAQLNAAFTPNTAAGYRGVYEIRLVTSASEKGTTATYDAADIQISGSTWTEIYPTAGHVKAAATKLTLKASKSTLKAGKKLTLTVKETPATSGTATFFDGSKKLGTAKVKKGKATFSTKKLKAGRHSLKAKFAPSSTANYKASTSKTVKVKITK